MSLIDTTIGVLMPSAYDRALAKPTRKRFYNITITLFSVILALLIGGIKAWAPSGAGTSSSRSPLK